MREIRQSGSEGGAAQFNVLSLPLSKGISDTNFFGVVLRIASMMGCARHDNISISSI